MEGTELSICSPRELCLLKASRSCDASILPVITCHYTCNLLISVPLFWFPATFSNKHLKLILRTSHQLHNSSYPRHYTTLARQMAILQTLVDARQDSFAIFSSVSSRVSTSFASLQ